MGLSHCIPTLSLCPPLSFVVCRVRSHLTTQIVLFSSGLEIVGYLECTKHRWQHVVPRAIQKRRSLFRTDINAPPGEHNYVNVYVTWVFYFVMVFLPLRRCLPPPFGFGFTLWEPCFDSSHLHTINCLGSR